MKRQLPPPAIFIDAQAMPLADVPTQATPSPAAFEANDVVAGDRSADRNGWGRRLRLRRCPQRQEGLIDSFDQRRHVRRRKLIFPEVTADDLGDQRVVDRLGGGSYGLHRERGSPDERSGQEETKI